jgi:hypothetical protein
MSGAPKTPSVVVTTSVVVSASSAVMIPRGWVLLRPTANPRAHECGACTDLPVPGPEREGQGTMGDAVETGCERFAIAPVPLYLLRARIDPDRHDLLHFATVGHFPGQPSGSSVLDDRPATLPDRNNPGLGTAARESLWLSGA